MKNYIGFHVDIIPMKKIVFLFQSGFYVKIKINKFETYALEFRHFNVFPAQNVFF